MCNPAALKAAEELHARSKGYSTSVKEKGPRKSAPKRAVERLQTAQVHQSHSIDDKLCYRLDDLSESERNVERTEGEDGEE